MAETKSQINVTMNLEGREITFERVFNASPELVFNAYSEPEHLNRWWGPKGWRTSTFQLDFRPGGVWHFCMRSPDGQMTPCAKFVYKEIIVPERIVYTESFVDEEGNPVGDLPDRLITVMFVSHGDKTKLVMRTECPSVECLQTIVDMGMVQGFTENLSRLEDYLRTLNTIQISEKGYVITRVLNAPRDLVFDAWSLPEHLSQWWGPKGFTNTFQKFDLRPGGHWQFIMHGPDGTDYPNHIVFIEVVKPERIVFQHKNPDFIATATFEDVNGRTKLTYSTLFKTVAEFDHVKPYAVPGGQQTVECLEEYLTKIPGGLRHSKN
jgi:uncharacterized protein YndB with AHSA1/START domain